MKTNLIKISLTAALAITALSVSAPAFAAHMTQSQKQYQTSRTQDYGSRQDQRYMDRGHSDRRWRNRGRYQTSRYTHGLPRSWRQVNGRIVKVGVGRYSGCFRVQRKGYYRRDPAIVTIRYCENAYGDPVKVRGSKRLVRYTRPMYYSY